MARNFKQYRVALYAGRAAYRHEEGGYYIPYNELVRVGYTNDLDEARKTLTAWAKEYDVDIVRDGLAVWEGQYVGESVIIAIESRFDGNFPRPNYFREYPPAPYYC